MYLWLKVLHIVAVVLFLGNITTGLFWHAHAAKTRDPAFLEHTMAGIIRSDRLFTVPAVLVIIASGVAAAISGGLPLLRTGWILWTLVLFAISGLAFMLRVAPLQRELLAFAGAGARSDAFDYAAYSALAARWERWGALALLDALRGARAHGFEARIVTGGRIFAPSSARARTRKGISMNGDTPVTANQDSKNIALLVWIGTIFFSFVPSLIVYLIKKDDPYVFDQSKEALNWSITAVIAYCIAWVLTIILIGPLLAGAVWLCNLVFSLMGAVACSNGRAFRVPFAVRLIK